MMELILACLRRIGIAIGLVGCGVGLRWATAGTLDQASMTELESLAAVGFAAVAWTAYGWLVVAIVATLLGELPGVIGRTAASVAAGITSEASRRLLRSALGVAAAAPLTVGVANAAPAVYGDRDATHVVQVHPHAAIDHVPPDPRVELTQRGWASIEKPSTVDLTGPPPGMTRRTALHDIPQETRDWAPVEPASSVSLTSARQANSDRIPVPDRPTAGRQIRYTEIDSARRPRPNSKSSMRVVVGRGDSLWTIAARELGPKATAAAIAKRWPQWYAANARVIGPNPHLLLPGQVLRAPAPSGSVR